MEGKLKQLIVELTAASRVYDEELIQTLWSGYGKILRYKLEDACTSSVIVKHVSLPNEKEHPRGWNTELSHQRKLKSYRVESHWYDSFASRCDDFCRVPKCLALEESRDEFLMILEDMDSVGFPLRKQSVSWSSIEACLSWLAYFHACFMAEEPEGLWEVGTYWHLDTRPDEWNEMEAGPLKNAASQIDALLNNCPYQTFVHGDAKLANFCFSQDGNSVSAVDFQYIGKGCGMKDLSYFVISCLDEEDSERLEEDLLSCYFGHLEKALVHYKKDIDFKALEKSWRAMYPVAWADFSRFLKGWCPDHWKINSYSERISRKVLAQLK